MARQVIGVYRNEGKGYPKMWVRWHLLAMCYTSNVPGQLIRAADGQIS